MQCGSARPATLPRSARVTGQLGLATAVVVVASAITVAAQNAGSSAPELYLDLETGLRFDDNYESLADPWGSTSLWETKLMLGYRATTPVDRFEFATGAWFDVGDFAEEPDQTTDIRDPFIELDYGRIGKHSSFDIGASYRETDNGVSFVEVPELSTDLIVDQGKRVTTNADVALALGQDGPLSFAGNLSYRQIRYEDTTDPDLADQELMQGDIEVGLALTRTARLLFLADYYSLDHLSSVGEDETRTSAGIGLSAAISPALSFFGSVSQSRDVYEYTAFGERYKQDESSPTVDLRLTRLLRNGAIFGSLQNNLTSTGLQSTLMLGREMELPRGSLDFSFGATRTDDGDINPVGALGWVRDYKTSQFSVDFNSSVGTEDDENYVNSYLSASFRQELTRQSGMEILARLSASEGIGDNDISRRQTTFEIKYSHEVTKHWDLVAGYRHSDSRDDDETISRNVVFTTLDRRFSIRP
ncbi:hypothetical protein [Tropicimonas sp.]|uniref:hypothetical protein n=1 Tax=Tropicimonas sp. TaxID=2067044 RepID=UPI003A87D213